MNITSKNLFWIFALFILVLPFVNASVSNDSLVVWTPINESSGNLNEDLAGGDNNLTVQAGTCTIVSTPYGYGRTNPSGNCKLAMSYSQAVNLSIASNWSMILMYNWTSGNGWVFSGTGSAIFDPILWGYPTAGEYASTDGASWNLWSNQGGNLNASQWICLGTIFNGTHYFFYEGTTSTLASTTKMINWPTPYFFYTQNQYAARGTITQFMLFKNRVLTETERTDLCANHSFTTPVPAPSLVINLTAPRNNEVFNNTQSILYNYTLNASGYDTFQCNVTRNNTNIYGNSSVGNLSTIVFTELNVPYGTHYWNVTCNTTISTTYVFNTTLILGTPRIYLNGLEQNRTYEYETYANITVINLSADRCLYSQIHNSTPINLTCGSASGNISYLYYVGLSPFLQSITTYVLNKTQNFQIRKATTFSQVNVTITGFNNTETFKILLNGTELLRIRGSFNNTRVNMKEFNDSLREELLSFAIQYNTKYLEFPNGANVTTAQIKIIGNSTPANFSVLTFNNSVTNFTITLNSYKNQTVYFKILKAVLIQNITLSLNGTKAYYNLTQFNNTINASQTNPTNNWYNQTVYIKINKNTHYINANVTLVDEK